MVRDLRLDVLRGIAIILVLFRHREICEPLHFIGWIGVDLFFVLSGFLVAGLIYKEFAKDGSVNLKRFFFRRGLKIWPSFYFLILATYVLKDYFQWEGYKAFIAEILFVQNYLPHLWGPTWSLAVEEHFYLLLIVAVGCLLVFKQNLHLIPATLLTIIVLCTSLRIINYSNNPIVEWYSHLTPSHLRLDSLCYGALLSYYWNFHRLEVIKVYSAHKFKLILLSFGFVLFFFFGYKSGFTVTIGFTLLSISFCSILLLTICSYFDGVRLGLIFNVPKQIVAIIGMSSYNIYLWHIPINDWFVKSLQLNFQLSDFTSFIIYFSLAVLVGVLFTNTVERYFLNLREKLVFSKN